MAYHFRTDQFEGPLDLLLSLIEKEKLDITQVSLAQVADQYLRYIEEEQSISLENLASFLSIASRLILIKSRALLPVLEFNDDEEEAMDDLETRLKLYKHFREAAQKLGLKLSGARPAFGRESFLGTQVVFYPPKDLTAVSLRGHFLDVLGEIPVLEELPEKELARVITLEEKILSLQGTLADRIETSFSELTKGAEDTVEVIVSFLAVLELIKQRFIFVEQKDFFGDIILKRPDQTTVKAS